MSNKCPGNIPVPIIPTQPSQLNNHYNNKNNQYQGVANVPSSSYVFDSSSYNQNNYINEMVINNPERYEKDFGVKNGKLGFQYFCSIFLLLVIIGDIVLEIYFGFLNAFGIIDDLAVIILVVKLLHLCIHKKNFYSKRLTLVVALIILFGFCLKGLSMAYCFKIEDINLVIFYGLLILLRTFGLVLIIPFSCR
jgi:hypothetical protein